MANHEVVKYDVVILNEVLEIEIDHSSYMLSFKDAVIWAIIHLKETGQTAIIKAMCFTEWAANGIAWDNEVWSGVRTEKDGIRVVTGTRQMPLGY